MKRKSLKVKGNRKKTNDAKDKRNDSKVNKNGKTDRKELDKGKRHKNKQISENRPKPKKQKSQEEKKDQKHSKKKNKQSGGNEEKNGKKGQSLEKQNRDKETKRRDEIRSENRGRGGRGNNRRNNKRHRKEKTEGRSNQAKKNREEKPGKNKQTSAKRGKAETQKQKQRTETNKRNRALKKTLIKTRPNSRQDGSGATNGILNIVQQVCSRTLTLDYNQVALIYSKNDGEKEKCNQKVETPNGTMIGFSCLTFDPNTKKCNKEFLELRTRVNGGKDKVKYCTTKKPENIIISSNNMALKYKRRQIKKNQCSGGFLCEVYTVGGNGGTTNRLKEENQIQKGEKDRKKVDGTDKKRRGGSKNGQTNEEKIIKGKRDRKKTNDDEDKRNDSRVNKNGQTDRKELDKSKQTNKNGPKPKKQNSKEKKERKHTKKKNKQSEGKEERNGNKGQSLEKDKEDKETKRNDDENPENPGRSGRDENSSNNKRNNKRHKKKKTEEHSKQAKKYRKGKHGKNKQTSAKREKSKMQKQKQREETKMRSRTPKKTILMERRPNSRQVGSGATVNIVQQVCSSTLTLDYNQVALIYSKNNGENEKCNQKVKTPNGTMIGFSCLTFDPNTKKCNKEFLELRTRVNGVTDKVKYCTTKKPENIIVLSNNMTIKYKRRQIKKKQCSGGFLCEVYTVGDALSSTPVTLPVITTAPMTTDVPPVITAAPPVLTSVSPIIQTIPLLTTMSAPPVTTAAAPVVTAAPVATSTPSAVTAAPVATATSSAVTVVPATTAGLPITTVTPEITASVITNDSPATAASTSASLVTIASTLATASVTPVTAAVSPVTTPLLVTTISPIITTAPITTIVASQTTVTSTVTTNCSLSRLYCDGCGIAPISIASTRIVNGTAASIGEYPYQVAVLSTIQNSQYLCGGAIIKERWILTAAHCFYDRSGNKATGVEVRYGSIDINGGTSVTASRFIDHPQYNRTTQANDIGVVELPHPLNYQGAANIQPICLGQEEDIPFGGKAIATGWGSTSFQGPQSSTLLEVELDVITIAECQTKLVTLPPNPENVLCALTSFKDTCQGDSGGPLVAQLCNGRWAVVGIVSFGIGCALPESPGVYTRVSAYADWISNTTGGIACNSTINLVSLANTLNMQRTTINDLDNEVVLGKQKIESLQSILNVDSGGRRRRRNLDLLQEQRNAFTRAAQAISNRNVLLMVSLKTDLVQFRGRLSAFIIEVAMNRTGLDVPAILAMAEEAINMANNVSTAGKLEIADIESEYQNITLQVEDSVGSIPALQPLEPKPTATVSVSPEATTTPCNIRRPYCDDCGIASVHVNNMRIVNGTKASVGEYPYQVALLSTIQGKSYLCSGTIIKDSCILTAAHCLYDKNKNRATRVEVRYGSILLQNQTSVIASRYIEHPGYTRTTLANDIAVVELPEPLVFSNTVRPICLGLEEDNPFGGKAVATGWGDIIFNGSGSNTLLEVALDVITMDDCEKNTSLPPDSTKVLCTRTPSKAPCHGDSGGPLVVQLCNGRFAQVGIISYSDSNCVMVDKPTVYTRVSAYLDWISNVTGGITCTCKISGTETQTTLTTTQVYSTMTASAAPVATATPSAVTAAPVATATPSVVTVAPVATATPSAVTTAPVATATSSAVTGAPATTAGLPITTVTPEITASVITNDSPATTASTSASLVTIASILATASVTPVTAAVSPVTTSLLVTTISPIITAPITTIVASQTAVTSTVTTTCSLSRLYCDGCGIAPISIASTRIVNGTAASIGEYPYQVAVLSTIQNSQYLCGGAIIKERWILTAAHCFYDRSGNKATGVEVRYGSIDINSGTSVTASRFIDHPQYNRTTQANDIGVVELPHPLNYQGAANIQPICLGQEEDIPFEGKAIATGWGSTSFQGPQSSTLLEVELDVITIAECQTKLVTLPPNPENVLCALTSFKDTCKGDSGGPLVAQLCNGRWAVVGIVSFGIGCALPENPGVYTRVSAYADWISNTTSGIACNSTINLVSLANTLNMQRSTINDLDNEVVLGKQKIESLQSILNVDNGGRRRRRNLDLLQEQRNAFTRAAQAISNRNVHLMVSLKTDLVQFRGRLSAFIIEVAMNRTGLDVPAILAMAEEAINMANNVSAVGKLEIADIESEYQNITLQVEDSGGSIPALQPLEPKPTATVSVSPEATTTPCNIRRPYCDDCGIASVHVNNMRIVNGTKASVGEYPYQVALLSTIQDKSYLCSGTIIKDSCILTAAHCLYDKNKNRATRVEVRYGSILLQNQTSVIASRYIEHPGYTRTTLANDIAVVELPKPLVFSNTVRPICLGLEEDNPFGGKAVATGWGDIIFNGSGSNTLLEVALDVITMDDCEKNTSLPPDSTKVLCTRTPSKAPCHGDSGGPLVVQLCNGRFAQVGIISYSDSNCVMVDKPTVYTRVSAYLDWISNVTGGITCTCKISGTETQTTLTTTQVYSTMTASAAPVATATPSAVTAAPVATATPSVVTVAPVATATPSAVTTAPVATATSSAVTGAPATTAGLPITTVTPEITASVITNDSPATTASTSASLVTIASILATASVTPVTAAVTAVTTPLLVTTISSIITTAPITTIVASQTAVTSTVTTNCSLSRLYCDGCGIAPISSASTRIVNGTAASIGEYPYQVAVLSTIQNSQYLCGGAIIKERWILTAAHCFYDRSGNKATGVEVRYGSIDINGGTSVTASRFIDHPQYNRTTQANDIGVVELPHPLNYQGAANIQPICLGQEEDIPFGGKAIATGWGSTSFQGPQSSTLLEVELDVITIAECQTKLVTLPPNPENVLCALTLFKDTCQGDSGGPLVAQLCNGRWAVVGIVSFGIGCALPESPGVYTRVSAYADWISNTTGGIVCNSTINLLSLANTLNMQRTTINDLDNEVVLGKQKIESLQSILNVDYGGRRRRRNLDLLQEQRNAFTRATQAISNRNVFLMVSLKTDLVQLRGRLSAFIVQVAMNTIGLDVPAIVAMAEEAINMANNVSAVGKLEIADIESEYQNITLQVEDSGGNIPALQPLEPKPTATVSVSPEATTTPCNIRRPYCDDCGIASVHVNKMRIVNGTKASVGEYPYQVALLSTIQGKSYLCSGTIIKDSCILTAAHCLYDKNKNRATRVEVRYGSILLQNQTSVIASRYIEHPGYTRTTLANDIAVVELPEPLVFSNTVRPICLGLEEDNPFGGKAVATGWGDIIFNGSGSNTLLEVVLDVITMDDCEKNTSLPPDSTKVLCTRTPSKAPCHGDSGGPLVVQLCNGRFAQVGIISYSNSNCAMLDKPTVYTRVSAYLDWISNVTGGITCTCKFSGTETQTTLTTTQVYSTVTYNTNEFNQDHNTNQFN
ncbi:uncharacterized threonine-rich GPI-anchored glycoprotein PJ4664.02-like isoform X2 [Penaeus chinensis]|uniref:uncharacterized threonine-rich GPI-anchored glycoprotein PJ4664.02-like isoform X2 n=1 Tax=Penaeus chinensis TaxID=139456 RepID=UPI001FB6A8A7|nr:uncharacterized threonine-rich GPI-anchored glycoprotein PJ4664.02-like isoform X2 [Penaeus chinensis]